MRLRGRIATALATTWVFCLGCLEPELRGIGARCDEKQRCAAFLICASGTCAMPAAAALDASDGMAAHDAEVAGDAAPAVEAATDGPDLLPDPADVENAAAGLARLSNGCPAVILFPTWLLAPAACVPADPVVRVGRPGDPADVPVERILRNDSNTAALLGLARPLLARDGAPARVMIWPGTRASLQTNGPLLCSAATSAARLAAPTETAPGQSPPESATPALCLARREGLLFWAGLYAAAETFVDAGALRAWVYQQLLAQPVPLSGKQTSSPSAIRVADGQIHVFSLGLYNVGYQKTWHPARGWDVWRPMAETILTAPVKVGLLEGTLWAFSRGDDGRLLFSRFSGDLWDGFRTQLLKTDGAMIGDDIGSGLAVTGWGRERLDLFVRSPDESLWHAFREGDEWSTARLIGDGGQVGHLAAIAPGPGRMVLFSRGADNVLWTKPFTFDWRSWESLGHPMGGDPAAAASGADRIDIMWLNAQRNLMHLVHEGGWWSAPVEHLGPYIGVPAMTARDAGVLEIFIQKPNGSTVSRRFADAPSSP